MFLLIERGVKRVIEANDQKVYADISNKCWKLFKDCMYQAENDSSKEFWLGTVSDGLNAILEPCMGTKFEHYCKDMVAAFQFELERIWKRKRGIKDADGRS
jgi:hypothetical protein